MKVAVIGVPGSQMSCLLALSANVFRCRMNQARDTAHRLVVLSKNQPTIGPVKITWPEIRIGEFGTDLSDNFLASSLELAVAEFHDILTCVRSLETNCWHLNRGGGYFFSVHFMQCAC